LSWRSLATMTTRLGSWCRFSLRTLLMISLIVLIIGGIIGGSVAGVLTYPAAHSTV
jgi:hypothetical protein